MAQPCFFVIDTNVLMHDPTALFRFHEHDLFIPMAVLEELDRHKKGQNEVARNARQASRFLDDLIQAAGHQNLLNGIALSMGESALCDEQRPTGHLYFQSRGDESNVPDGLGVDVADNTILGCAMALCERNPERKVALVTKDINLRIKAAAAGIEAQDYRNDHAVDDLDLLPRGSDALAADFWESLESTVESWTHNGKDYYRVHGEITREFCPNQFVYLEGDLPLDAMVLEVDRDAPSAVLEALNLNAMGSWGVKPRNREQAYALRLLMDPEIDFVSLVGGAGTGKTLLALAAGLSQVLDRKTYREVLMTRATIPVGEDIGFLPGTEEEKMMPWMGALMDNLEALVDIDDSSGDWSRQATHDLIEKRVKVRSMNFMRGRTFFNRYIILDEAQNLTVKQMKTLITRAGPDTKIVALGNLDQIDTPYLTETSSGLTYVVDRFREFDHGGHLALIQGERSRLSAFASEHL
ncbi:PhoH family protein [Thioalkalivibrio sp. K90mix]|uniref:PhoH family protein n=1 Tax=Thioalkalivibrio sp. (strain K90mix) TaxID=396595 RepID=UPI000195A43F|nr:PhoH family protein [Thioalkalivibrio sp. K90mix]